MPALSTEQARWLRFRRSGLYEPFTRVPDIAHALVGVQAQMPVAADLALYNRLSTCTQASLLLERIEARSVVRLWGQRNTVHIYAAQDWPLLALWFRGRNSVMGSKILDARLGSTFDRFVSYLEKRLRAGEHLTYKDCRGFADFAKLDAVRKKWMSEQSSQGGSEWLLGYAAMMRLAREGRVCHGPDDAGESTFVHRDYWIPGIEPPVASEPEGFAEAARRFLRTYGPSTPRDLAAYFGITVLLAKTWIGHAGEDIVQVLVDGQSLLMCGEDVALASEIPPTPAKWPVRMLYRFDPYVLGAVGARDKAWLIDESHIRKVWRPAAQIEAVILLGGRVGGTWRYKRRARGLVFEVQPFASLSKRVEREVRQQAKAIGGFLGSGLLSVDFAQ